MGTGTVTGVKSSGMDVNHKVETKSHLNTSARYPPDDINYDPIQPATSPAINYDIYDRVTSPPIKYDIHAPPTKYIKAFEKAPEFHKDLRTESNVQLNAYIASNPTPEPAIFEINPNYAPNVQTTTKAPQTETNGKQPPSMVHSCHNAHKQPTPAQIENDRLFHMEQQQKQQASQTKADLRALRQALLYRTSAKFIKDALKYDDLKNNMLFERTGLGRAYVQTASTSPPKWDTTRDVGVLDATNLNDNNKSYIRLPEPDSGLIYAPRYGLMSNTMNEVENQGRRSVLHVYGKVDYKENVASKVHLKQVEDKDNTVIIPSKNDKWWITVPIKMKNGEVVRAKMLADAGANIPCLDTKWAITHMKQCIMFNNTQSRILTAGSNVLKPKYIVWMTFPTKSGKILKAKFYLVDNLPVSILADLNMLRAFGYKFRDETPPVFSHKAQFKDNLDLKEYAALHKIHFTNEKASYDILKQFKQQKLQKMTQQEEYNRAKHTHFIQMAMCMSTLIKDGVPHSDELYNPYGNEEIHQKSMLDNGMCEYDIHDYMYDEDIEEDNTLNRTKMESPENYEVYYTQMANQSNTSKQASCLSYETDTSLDSETHWDHAITRDLNRLESDSEEYVKTDEKTTVSTVITQQENQQLHRMDYQESTQDTWMSGTDDEKGDSKYFDNIQQNYESQAMMNQNITQPSRSPTIDYNINTNNHRTSPAIDYGINTMQRSPTLDYGLNINTQQDSPAINYGTIERSPTIDYEAGIEVSPVVFNYDPYPLGADIDVVGITPDIEEIPDLTPGSPVPLEYGESTPQVNTLQGTDTEEEDIDMIANRNASQNNEIHDIGDIIIPGTDQIEMRQGDLLHNLNNINNRTHGNKINSLLTTTKANYASKNKSALRRTPNRSHVHRITGTIGNTRVKLLNNIHMNNYIVSVHNFKATHEEIKKAALLQLNEALKFNKLGYLKELEKLYPKKYYQLYKEVIRVIENFKHVFAKRLFDRRTLTNVKPARLGIKPEHRDDVCFIKQYNIPPTQRLHMIKYTQHNDTNGFWRSISDSKYCIPYTMVAKKNSKGVITRWRPAFDGRGINKWCKQVTSWMPTIRDFDEFFALKGLITIADCKNFFDCIPLHVDDWKYATVMSPLGMRQMKHLTYGWMNAAPIAQNIMNRLCLVVGWMLGYIDDIAIKHPWYYGTTQLIKHLIKFLKACEKLGVLLHPGKFWPFATEVTSLGRKRTLWDSSITEAYRAKVLKMNKPQTIKQMRSADGVLKYIGKYVENYSFYQYWLLRIMDDTTQGGRLKWTDQANYAWNMIMKNVQNSKILYNPTRNGSFCIKTDASKYGIGAVLYQYQYDAQLQTWRWRIIDMYSAIIKQDLRKAHSMVHEALAIVKACEHWQFHLMKRKFKISCDNNPIVHIFDGSRKFDPTTRQQLGRLRTQVNGFTFDIAHVPGVQNEMADGLSRDTVDWEDDTQPLTQPIKSMDTGNKDLTQAQRDELETKYIKNDHTDASEVKYMNQINMINFQSHTVNHTALLIDDYVHPNNKQQRCQILRKESKRQYNKICGDFKRHAIHSQKKRIKRFINENGNNLMISDEYQLNTKPCIKLLNDMQPVLLNLEHMSNTSMSYVEELVNDMNINVENQDTTEDVISYTIPINSEKITVAEVTPDAALCKEFNVNLINATHNDSKSIEIKDLNLLNMVRNQANIKAVRCEQIKDKDGTHMCCISEKDLDEEYRPKYSKKKAPKTQGMQTRSRTRAKHSKIKPKSHRVDFINPDGDKITTRMKTRDEFMNELVGYRNQMDFFEVNTFRTYQETDLQLQTLRYLIQNEIFTEKFISDEKILIDIQFMENYMPRLYNAWRRHELRINDTSKIIQKQIFPYGKDAPIYVDVVPELLIGRILDYGHHNLSLNHLGEKQTLDSIECDYWWDTMDEDVKTHVKECRLCQYVKHGKTLKAPMRIRDLPKPRQHIMADFLDCVYAKYHILVIVDYGSNYAMLIPCERCDTRAVVDALITKWIPIFGLFNTFETDFGSGFNNKVIKMLNQLIGIQHNFAEARNHRGIGKVERLIGFIQTIFNLYNVQSNNKLLPSDTSQMAKDEVWERVKALLPFIQQSLNRRKPRFTQYSPNMIMFGSELNDYGNIKNMIRKLNKNQKDEDNKLSKTDYEYIAQLLKRLQSIQSSYEADWKKYTRYSAVSYAKAHHIQAVKDLQTILNTYHVGDKVLYYIGDRQVAQRKWRQRWSGPWTISSVDQKTGAIEITDGETVNSKHVSVDRIKHFNDGFDTISFEAFEKLEEYQYQLQQQCYNRHEL